jgi:hypothetical protein
MDEIPQWMKDHIEADHDFQQKMVDLIPTLVTKEDIKGLATEKSVRDVVHWQKNIVAAGEIISGTGRFSYRTILILASLLGALAIITGAWKGILAWALTAVPK